MTNPSLIWIQRITLTFPLCGSSHICPVGGTVLTLIFSRAWMVLCASSNSELSWETRVSRYFLSLLRLSDCNHTRIHIRAITGKCLLLWECKMFVLLDCSLLAWNLTAMWRCSPSRLLACLVPVWVSKRLQHKEKHWRITLMIDGVDMHAFAIHWMFC